MKMGMLRYPISEILVDRLTSGKRPESCNYFERGEVKAFGTATSYELQGDYCSPVEAESGFLRLCALGSGAFFDFSIGIWQRERTNLLYARRPGFLMYFAFCKSDDLQGAFFVKLGIKQQSAEVSADPFCGPPDAMVGYLCNKKSKWDPCSSGSGLFTFMVPDSYRSYHEAAEPMGLPRCPVSQGLSGEPLAKAKGSKLSRHRCFDLSIYMSGSWF